VSGTITGMAFVVLFLAEIATYLTFWIVVGGLVAVAAKILHVLVIPAVKALTAGLMADIAVRWRASYSELLCDLWFLLSFGVALYVMYALDCIWPLDLTLSGSIRLFANLVISIVAWLLWLLLGVLISALISAWFECRRSRRRSP